MVKQQSFSWFEQSQPKKRPTPPNDLAWNATQRSQFLYSLKFSKGSDYDFFIFITARPSRTIIDLIINKSLLSEKPNATGNDSNFRSPSIKWV